MTEQTKLGGPFTLSGTSIGICRMGYGAMQLAGTGVWGPPKDPDGAIGALREAIVAGVNHIDTADLLWPARHQPDHPRSAGPIPLGANDRHEARGGPPARQIVAAGHIAPRLDRGRPRQPAQPGSGRARHRELPRDGDDPQPRGGVHCRTGDRGG